MRYFNLCKGTIEQWRRSRRRIFGPVCLQCTCSAYYRSMTAKSGNRETRGLEKDCQMYFALPPPLLAHKRIESGYCFHRVEERSQNSRTGLSLPYGGCVRRRIFFPMRCDNSRFYISRLINKYITRTPKFYNV